MITNILLVCLLVLPLHAQESPNFLTREKGSPIPGELLKWREVFTYNVKYSFFTLGKVRVEVTDTLYQGEPAWKLTGIITSNPGIPFVGKEENHYSSIFKVIDGKPRELVYWKDNVDEEKFDEERFIYNYNNRKVYAFKEGEPTDTLDLKTPATSGPLIFFFSRLHAGRDVNSRTYVYLEDEQGTIDMEYTRRRDEREYEAFEQPINTFYAEGIADIDGPFGFGGDFKTWFANDELRIPLEAHVKVWLGNVKVRLIDYKKELRNE
ncbi:DUF3108 domain-containing protein [Aliifodinibius sp. S!AR15-10]|uniref:DUF3108 domain-containing protein n=1 Tax=Aliifodinibius sp. S!AR15-10 TaxID=2950437 RepID=UPI00286FE919|nr:DUF3108 domain-containing protein [Aliifodinibius sp. S!AR15-10]